MPLPGETRVLPDADAVGEELARELVRAAREAVARRGELRVALAGGSTPRRAYELLGGPEGASVPWPLVHLHFGDERCVPPDHADSNFRMVRETLLARRDVPDANVHRLRGEDPDPERAARTYEEDLRRSFALVGSQLPRFDLVLLGMGADGHCASVFPDSSAASETRRLAVATRVEKLDAWRLTLTLPVLCAAARVVFAVAGADKADMLGRVLRDVSGSARRPASLVRPVRGSLTWLVDRAAAGALAGSSR